MNIGKAAALAQVSQRMIRHYEKIGLVPAPSRRESGYRDYSDADVHRLRFIANARDLGFPIEEIRTLLGLWADRDRSSAEVKALAEARAAELGRKAQALEAMRRALSALAANCQGNDPPDCPACERLDGKPLRASQPMDQSKRDKALDEALEESFPASDPPALTQPAAAEPRHEVD